MLPSVVIGAAFASLLGPGGVVDLRGTWWAVIAAHVCFNLAVVIRDGRGGDQLAGPRPGARGARCAVPRRPGTLRRVVPAARRARGLVGRGGRVPVLPDQLRGDRRAGWRWVTTIEVEIWVRATRQFDLPGAAVPGRAAGCSPWSWRWRLAGAVGHGRPRPLRPASRQARAPAPGSGSRSSGPRRVVLAGGRPAPGGTARAVPARRRRLGPGRTGARWARPPRAPAWPSIPRPRWSPRCAPRRRQPCWRWPWASPRPLRWPAGPGRSPAGSCCCPWRSRPRPSGLGLLLVAGRPPLDLRGSAWLVVVAQALVALPAGRAGRGAGLRRPAAERARVGAARRRGPPAAVVARRAAHGPAGDRSPPPGLAADRLPGRVRRHRVRRPDERIPRFRWRSSGSCPGRGRRACGQAMALSSVLAALCAVLLWVVDRVAGDRGVTL